MHIAVIGAGPYGLAFARQAIHDGFDVTVFEIQDQVGGVWNSAYSFAQLQNTYQSYYFAEFPHIRRPPAHPTKLQLQPYFAAYAERYGVMKRIRFGHTVLSIEERGDGERGWGLVVRDDRTGHVSRETFGYVVNAQGSFSSCPNVPYVEGRDSFQGKVLHSSEVKDETILSTGNVVLLGFGRSGLDFSVRSVKNRKAGDHGETHLVARTPRWLIPQYILGIHADYLLYNRMSTAMMSAWFHLGFEKLIHGEDKPKSDECDPVGNTSFVARAFWGFIQFAVRVSCGLWNGNPLLPKHHILDDFRVQIAMEPAGFYSLARKNKIKTHIGVSIAKLQDRQVFLTDGTVIENVDTVILATGFDFKQKVLLPKNKEYLLEKDGIYLYRHLVHPDLKDMAFMGKNHSLLSIPIAELTAHWITANLREELQLPSREAQLESIQALRKWKRAHLIESPVGRAIDVNTRFQQYLDELCVDLGITPFRKIKRVGGWWNPFGLLFEAFGACGPKDYEFSMVRRELVAVAKSRKKFLKEQ
ncbi:hypothetical protein HDU99_008299 [Rhizoclosmatium hyalinum]|nr:hypothetical protein HDU99_008299 [Rhizoclosmatium hyalinum]